MTNSRFNAAMVLGTLLIVGVLVAFLPPVPKASAESQAKRICREQGLKPGMSGYDYCVMQTSRALEWGEPELAYSFARMTAISRDACLEYGLHPRTSGLQACVDKETTARAILIYANEEPKYGPQIASHD
jgi:hypothetical protein